MSYPTTKSTPVGTFVRILDVHPTSSWIDLSSVFKGRIGKIVDPSGGIRFNPPIELSLVNRPPTRCLISERNHSHAFVINISAHVEVLEDPDNNWI